MDQYGEWAKKQYCHLMQAHLLVVIKADPRQKYWEDAFSAAAALIQNIQLLAWEREIGVVWKTNEYNWDPQFHKAVGLMPEERIIGTLHLGYFDKTPRPKPRTPLEQLLTVIQD
ncbi:nitroreductase family protein [Paenibacillus sepulcri]|uniref:nitroreductase family protein n=1 Tax=Paenibacillus sepulcri TaxID=359917 RepID=UPI0035E9DD6C